MALAVAYCIHIFSLALWRAVSLATRTVNSKVYMQNTVPSKTTAILFACQGLVNIKNSLIHELMSSHDVPSKNLLLTFFRSTVSITKIITKEEEAAMCLSLAIITYINMSMVIGMRTLCNESHDQNEDWRKVTMCITNPFYVYYLWCNNTLNSVRQYFEPFLLVYKKCM